MSKNELKTKLNDASVTKFLNTVNDEKKRADSFKVLDIMSEITGEEPKMWGTSIVGFGSYHYKYASGHEGDMPITGFSPRKQSLTLYLMLGISNYSELLEILGKHKTGKGCLYINSLDEINISVLKKLIKKSVNSLKKKYK